MQHAEEYACFRSCCMRAVCPVSRRRPLDDVGHRLAIDRRPGLFAPTNTLGRQRSPRTIAMNSASLPVIWWSARSSSRQCLQRAMILKRMRLRRSATASHPLAATAPNCDQHQPPHTSGFEEVLSGPSGQQGIWPPIACRWTTVKLCP